MKNAVVNPEVEATTQSWVKHLVWYLRRLQQICRGVVTTNDSMDSLTEVLFNCREQLRLAEQGRKLAPPTLLAECEDTHFQLS